MTSAIANVAASQTDAVILAAIHAGVRIRVLGVFCLAGGVATNLTFNSKGSGAGTAISCLLANGANGGAVMPLTPPANPEYQTNAGWFETLPGEALTVTTGAGSSTGIIVIWEPSPPVWKT